MIDDLQRRLGTDIVSTRLIERLAYSRDASLYAMLPQAVVRPRTVQDVVTTFAWCTATGGHCTVRAAGTSLSGQAVTDGVILDVSRHFTDWTIEDDGARIRLQPGVIGAHANAHLRRFGRKIGPDPASIMACMIGGIVANNASGMCCGTAQNTYHTMHSIRFLLANGTRIDTADDRACLAWSNSQDPIAIGIAQLRDEIRSDRSLVDTIRRKYRIKNTIGYSLNAFLDEDEPARILGKLMVGSEGTLGFIEEVVLTTIPAAPFALTSMMMFRSVDDACACVDALRYAGAAAIELLDGASLRSINLQDAAALLVEFQYASEEERATHAATVQQIGSTLPTVGDVVWTTDVHEQQRLWKLRKGLMPTIGAMRPQGSTMINEDIAVPPHHLAALVADVQQCFADHGYTEAIIFGHAKDGNIHFVVNQQFRTEADTEQYARFMDAIAHIVVDVYQGSLKAEHGTGRNMAPFVEMEWGSVAYDIMKRVKHLVDPHCILNPGVVMSDDPRIHLKNIKAVPAVDAETDRCIECGFCEHVCPSRTLTLTPRQRIAVRRELVHRGRQASTEQVFADFQHDGIETCAADGICATVCPVGIDTGSLIKRLRHDATGSLTQSAATYAASMFSIVDATARAAVSVGHSLVPALRHARPAHLARSTPQELSTADVIVLPSCGARWMGGEEQGTDVIALMRIVAERAGLRTAIPSNASSLCCGQVFQSKGLTDAAHRCSTDLARAVQHLEVNEGAVVVTDSTTCATSMSRSTSVIDPITFLSDHVLPRLTIRQRKNAVVLHPGCGVATLGLRDRMELVAHACANAVHIPVSASCCGMAGDRGIMHPDLVHAALAAERRDLTAIQADGYYAANTACEAALTREIGVRYRPLVALVEESSRPTS